MSICHFYIQDERMKEREKPRAERLRTILKALSLKVIVEYLGLCGLLALGSGPVPKACAGFCKPILHTELPLPALIQGRRLVLP